MKSLNGSYKMNNKKLDERKESRERYRLFSKWVFPASGSIDAYGVLLTKIQSLEKDIDISQK
jgi:hypothetical protein